MLRPAVQSNTRMTSARPLPRPRRQRAHRNKANSFQLPAWSVSSRHCFLVLIFLLAQVILFTSSLFQVQRIYVAGTETLTSEQVLRQCGLKNGQYLWRQQPGEVAGRVAQLQNVAGAHVSYILPGQVNITVHERQPVYQVASNTPNPTWYAVDEQGLVLRKLKGTSNQYPRLKLEESIQVGKRLHPALIATCSQACGLIEQEFPASIWYYTMDQRGNLSFRTFSRQYPVDVQLGSLDNLNYKLKVLRALMNSVMQHQQVAGIDLRFSTPVVRLLHPPKPPETPEPHPT
ncbi:MAG: FtsQ-type POTRA domain-containing protein [Candidatus Eremiobacteraeota bacterium]|nr:FtsQ-type POTRA domain-containing protein [Candidatus Eremiobacteraeota bacterium]